MPNLEEVLRDLAERGELNHLSIGPSQKLGETWAAGRGKPTMFRAEFAMCSKFGLSFAEDPDPVKAIVLACTTAKMKPASKTRVPISLDLKAEHVETAPAAEDPLADLM